MVSVEKLSKLACINPECPLHGKLGEGNIKHDSWIGKDQSIERVRCTHCKKNFLRTKGLLEKTEKLTSIAIKSF